MKYITILVLRMMILILLFICTNAVAAATRQRPDIDKLFRRKTGRSFMSNENASWLLNGNKIGLGYNPLYGSPVCYTGDCQMEGFSRPVFKLNFTKQAQGSCTNKFIPQYTTLDCLPSMDTMADTEIISTLSQLQQSMTKGIEVATSARIKFASFSYSHSRQTTWMIDKIYKHNTTVIHTNSKVSFIRLSMFEPLLELSDEFMYVIDQMPCCDTNDTEAEQYIYDYVFGYFGYTFVTDLLLGGVAQQNIFIRQEDVSSLEQNGLAISNQAELRVNALAMFSASFKTKITENYDRKKYDTFMKYTQTTRSTKLGGDSALTSIDEWSKTIPSNPIIIKFGIKYLFTLLNKRRFPGDKDILKKAALIEQTLNKYIHNPVFCYGNCSNNGVCQPSGYFQFGMCACKSDWTGVDCSLRKIKSIGITGMWCGSAAVACGGNNITGTKNCTQGWSYAVHGPRGGFCHKTQDGDSTATPTGTICGLNAGSIRINCSGRNPFSDACPTGYNRSTSSDYCYKSDEEALDLAGTLCGIKFEAVDGRWLEFPCNGYYPGRGACPEGYLLVAGHHHTVVHQGCIKRLPWPCRTVYRDQHFHLSTCVKQ